MTLEKYSGPVRECPYVDGGFVPSNILDEYSTATYNIKLYMLGLGSLISGAGEGGQGFIRDENNEIIIAQTGITDIKIDDLVISSVVGGGGEGSSSNSIGTNINFKLIQPLRCDLMERLLAAQEALNLKPFQEFPLFLEIGFVGGQKFNSGNLNPPIEYEAPTKIIRMLLSDFDLVIQSNSSEYNFACIGYEDGIFEANLERRQSLNKFSIVYSTIKEGLDNLAKGFNRLNKNAYSDKIRENKADVNETPGQTPYDIHEFDTDTIYPKPGEEGVDTEALKIMQNWPNSLIDLSSKIDTSKYSAESVVVFNELDLEKQEDLTVPANADANPDATYIYTTFPDKTDLVTAATKIILQDIKIQNMVIRLVSGKSLADIKKLIPTDLDYDKTAVFWFDIKTDIAPIGVNYLHNRVAYKYTHRIMLKRVYSNMFIMPDEILNITAIGKQNLQEELNAITHRYYPYIFTGQNDQILNAVISDTSGNGMMLTLPTGGVNLKARVRQSEVKNQSATEVAEEFDQKYLAGVLSQLDVAKYVTKLQTQVEDVIVKGAQATVQDFQRVVTLARTKGFSALLGGDIDFVNTRIDPKLLGRISPLGEAITKFDERLNKAKSLVSDIKNLEDVIEDDFGQVGEDIMKDFLAKATNVGDIFKQKIEEFTGPLKAGLLAPIQEQYDAFKNDMQGILTDNGPLLYNLGIEDEFQEFFDNVFDPVDSILSEINNTLDSLTDFDGLLGDLIEGFNDPRVIQLSEDDIPVKYLDDILEVGGFDEIAKQNEAPTGVTTSTAVDEVVADKEKVGDLSVTPNVMELLYHQNQYPAFLKTLDLEIKGDPYWLPGTLKTSGPTQEAEGITEISSALNEKQSMLPSYFERLFIFSFTTPDYDVSLGKASAPNHGRYTGYYLATMVEHTFQGGIYTSRITGVKNERLANPEKLNSVVKDDTTTEPIEFERPLNITMPVWYQEGGEHDGLYLDAAGEFWTGEEIQEWQANQNNETDDEEVPIDGG